MKKKCDFKRLSSVLAAAVGATLLLTDTLAAAGSGEPPLTDVKVAPDLVQWFPGQAADGMEIALTISTPSGEVLSRTFSAKEVPAYPVYVEDSLEDGSYTYELYAVPLVSAPKVAAAGSDEIDENGRPLGVVRTAKSGSNAAAGGYSRRGLVQSGYFTVMDGIILDPGAAE